MFGNRRSSHSSDDKSSGVVTPVLVVVSTLSQKPLERSTIIKSRSPFTCSGRQNDTLSRSVRRLFLAVYHAFSVFHRISLCTLFFVFLKLSKFAQIYVIQCVSSFRVLIFIVSQVAPPFITQHSPTAMRLKNLDKLRALMVDVV